MDDVYENVNNYNPSKKRKVLIIFDDMIADVMTNTKFKSIIKELFIRCRKLKYFSCFYHSILFFCPKGSKIKFNTLFHHEN